MNNSKALAAIHLSTMLFGLSAVIAKQLSVSATVIVAGRAVSAALTLFVILMFSRRKIIRGLTAKDAIHSMISGGLLALHWICFFIGVEKGGVAVGTLGFACFPVFVSLFGWCIFRLPVAAGDIVAILLLIIGLVIISPGLMQGSSNNSALLWALAAGGSYAIIVLYNNHVHTEGSPLQSSFIQCVGCALVTLPVSYETLTQINALSVFYIGLIGVLCTGIAYSMLTYALRYLNAGKAAVIITLEPVWAILFSVLWFRVMPDLKILVGGCVMLTAVIISELSSRNKTGSVSVD